MPNYITKEGLEKLKEELKELKTKEMKRITKLIAEAAAFGDLKENSAYHEARHMKSLLLGRIEQLEDSINSAVVTDKKEGIVEVGSEVEMLFGEKKETYSIVAPVEANILKNKISYLSPLGKDLLHKKTGDSFHFEGGDQKIIIKIIKVS